MSLIPSLPSITKGQNKRVGRGYGSGKGGHTSTRGTKGQKSRRGAIIPLFFEGGNLPLVKRLPMLRGKKRLKAVRPSVEISLTDIAILDASPITLDTLRLAGMVPQGVQKVKIVANGEITKAITVEGIAASAAAREKIVAAGGKLI